MEDANSLLASNATPIKQLERTMAEPKNGEWWMCESPKKRTCPMLRCEVGWGCIRNSDGSVDIVFLKPYESLVPLYKMAKATGENV